MRDNDPRLMRGGAAAITRALVAGALVLLFATALLLSPAFAFAQTDAPGFVYAKAMRGHLVAVNWEPPLYDTDPDMTYRIYRAEGAVLPGFDPAVEPGTAWSLAGVRAGRTNISFCDNAPKKTSTRYWYVVTAQNSTAATSLASPVNSPHMMGGAGDQWEFYQPSTVADSYQWFIGPTTLAPLEPSNVQLSGADTTITVTWDPVPSTNVARYHIYRAEVSGSDGVWIGSVEAPGTEFVDMGVEKYRHYWYRIAAEDTEGAIGSRSIERHFRSVSSTSPPSPHTGDAASPEGETCSVCHRLHEAPSPKLLKSEGDTEVALCLTCHDGTGSQFDVRREYTDTHLSSHAVTVTAGEGVIEAEGAFLCVDCHEAHGGAQPSPKLLSVDGVTSGNGVCYGSGCHGPVDPADGIDFSDAFEASVHNTEIPGPDSGTEVKCSTCHQPHASPNESLWTSAEYRACFRCHANGQDSIYARITLNNDPDTSHDVLARAQAENGTYMACQHCHNTHAVTADRPLVDPWSPGITPEEQWSETRTAPLAVDDSSTVEPRYNEFCFSCHGNAGLPKAEDTLPWVDPPDDNDLLTKNIEEDWKVRVHGRDSRGGAVLDPVMGYENGQTLSCMTCHEPHGTINNYNLRGDVPAIDGTFPKERLLLVQSLDTTGQPIPGAFDTRFFCSSCHLQTSDPATGDMTSPPQHQQTSASNDKTYYWFPSGCTASDCHVHESTTTRRF